MANSRIARFITEVAPPQFISVMRHRTSKVLDTINEEEKDVSPTKAATISSSSSSASGSISTTTTACGSLNSKDLPRAAVTVNETIHHFGFVCLRTALFGFEHVDGRRWWLKIRLKCWNSCTKEWRME
ncbi:hypothetical protein PanWU01x14_064620 [Parasponia andersonii]|uniref:Uncharacterized protein n=1 Tax=Parasponia andersonii TaxID=3476 RepID=A0A2P5DHF0_PARAD|nr:hypothetical protein PanWU01x14_064620 [Parasponia andersonii]